MKRKWKLIGCVVTLIVILFVLKNVFSGIVSPQDSVLTVYDAETEVTTIYVNGKIVDSVPGQVATYSNEDNSAYYITTTVDEVYFLKGTKLKLIPDIVDFVNIADHSKEALVLDAQGVLYLYDGSDLTELTEEPITSAQLSGNGKYYVYNTDGNGYFGRKSGDEIKVEGAIIRYISETGKYIYAYEYEETLQMEVTTGGQPYTSDYRVTNDFNLLLVDRKGKTECLAEEVSEVVALNEDGSEIMYLKDDGTYISVKGKESIKVCEEYVESIYCKGEISGYDEIYPAKTLKETVAIVKKGSIEYGYVINKKYEAKLIHEDSFRVHGVNDKLTKIYYTDKSGNLYVARVTAEAEGQLLAENVDDVWLSKDGKHIYYADYDAVNDTSELYYIKEKAEPKKVGNFGDFLMIDLLGDEGYITYGGAYYLKGDEAVELDEFREVVVNTSAQKVYAIKENSVYEMNGENSKKLEGSYENIDYLQGAD